MLISLRQPKSKGYCSNRLCSKRLRGPFKILRRGEGPNFDICMSCFNAIMKKGGPDRYLPGKKEIVGKDESTGAELHDATEKPYIPLGTHKLTGQVKLVTNQRTGQILL